MKILLTEGVHYVLLDAGKSIKLAAYRGGFDRFFVQASSDGIKVYAQVGIRCWFRYVTRLQAG